MALEQKNKGIQAWQMIAGDLGVQVQNDSWGLRAINLLPGLSYRSLKGRSLGRWVKPVWGITRRTEIEYPVYVNTAQVVNTGVMRSCEPKKEEQGLEHVSSV